MLLLLLVLVPLPLLLVLLLLVLVLTLSAQTLRTRGEENIRIPAVNSFSKSLRLILKCHLSQHD